MKKIKLKPSFQSSINLLANVFVAIIVQFDTSSERCILKSYLILQNEKDVLSSSIVQISRAQFESIFKRARCSHDLLSTGLLIYVRAFINGM